MSFSLWLETIQRDTREKVVWTLWCEDSEGGGEKKKKVLSILLKSVVQVDL